MMSPRTINFDCGRKQPEPAERDVKGMVEWLESEAKLKACCVAYNCETEVEQSEQKSEPK